MDTAYMSNSFSYMSELSAVSPFLYPIIIWSNTNLWFDYIEQRQINDSSKAKCKASALLQICSPELFALFSVA